MPNLDHKKILAEPRNVGIDWAQYWLIEYTN